MAAKKSSDVKSSTDVSVEATIMSIREQLMIYFKGSCVQHMTSNTNIHVYLVEISMRGRPNYNRVQILNNCLSRLFIGTVPLMTLGKMPETVTLHTDILRRSPQFRAIQTEVEKFLGTYLPGVIVEHQKGAVVNGE